MNQRRTTHYSHMVHVRTTAYRSNMSAVEKTCIREAKNRAEKNGFEVVDDAAWRTHVYPDIVIAGVDPTTQVWVTGKVRPK